jgi:hypothetical protein
LDDDALRDDHGSVSERGLRVADLRRETHREIVGPIGVNARRVRSKAGLDVYDHGQRVVVDLDPLQSVLGGVAALRDDQGHRLAHVAHLVAGQRVLPSRAELEAHAGLERRRSHPRLRDGLEGGQGAGSEDGGHPRARPGRFRADDHETRVGVGAPEHRGVQTPRWRHVVHEPTPPREVARILLTPDNGTDVFRSHGAAT